MTKPLIEFVETDDWIDTYVDGEPFAGEHSLSIRTVISLIERLGGTVKRDVRFGPDEEEVYFVDKARREQAWKDQTTCAECGGPPGACGGPSRSELAQAIHEAIHSEAAPAMTPESFADYLDNLSLSEWSEEFMAGMEYGMNALVREFKERFPAAADDIDWAHEAAATIELG